MIKFGNKTSNFEIKSEIAHVNFKYVSFQAFKCYWIVELLSHCHRERHVSLQHGSPKQTTYWEVKQIRYLNLSRAEFSGSSPLHLLELVDPMQLVHSLDQKSPFKTKLKENGKCKAGNVWKEEDKDIKINPMVTFTKFKNSNKKPVQDSSLCPGSTLWPVSIPLMLFPI